MTPPSPSPSPEIYDLISLPSEISILGYFHLGVYIMEIVTMDMDDAVDPYRSRSNQDIIIGLQEHGDHPYRSIDHRLWDIPINIPDTFIYHMYPYDPGSFQLHIPLHHPQR
jgi:hypothetical protein